MAAGLELPADRLGVHHLQGQVAGLELAAGDFAVVGRALEAEQAAVELLRRRVVLDEDGREIDSGDVHSIRSLQDCTSGRAAYRKVRTPVQRTDRVRRGHHLPMESPPRQIVAFGGGGFSMESGNPLLDDYVLGLCGAGAAAGLLPALGQRRRRPLRGPLLPRLPRRPLRGEPHLPLPPRAGPRGPARAPPLPGPDLRRRRQRDQPARRLAGARHRRDPARSVGGGRRPLRPLGRLALLVLGGGHRLPRRAALRRGPRPAAVQQLRPLPARLGAAPRLPRPDPRRDALRVRGRGRRRPALHRHRAEPGRRLAAGGARLPARPARRAGRRDADRDHLPRRRAGRCRWSRRPRRSPPPWRPPSARR